MLLWDRGEEEVSEYIFKVDEKVRVILETDDLFGIEGTVVLILNKLGRIKVRFEGNRVIKDVLYLPEHLEPVDTRRMFL